MLFVDNYNRDPYQNHALEEWLMDRFDEDCFMLWRNEKAILLGRNQNAYNEINMEYAKTHNIKIVRRITGGGTVFTDEGNIMFTFISCDSNKDFSDFRKFTKPILKCLRDLGIQAQFSGRNDLTINGRKFSGNAQCRYKNKVLHHGTLMYKANTSQLSEALTVREIKLRDKGVASIKSRVTNISEHMMEDMDIDTFYHYLIQGVKHCMEDVNTFTLSSEDWKEVKARSLEKHADNKWIYGHAPDFDLQRETKLSGGIVDIFLDIKKGRILRAGIFGDFFNSREISEIEEALVGVMYEKEAIKFKLSAFEIDEYFKNISTEELINAII